MPEVQFGVRFKGWEEPCKDRSEAEVMAESDGVKLIAREVVYGEWHEISRH